MQAEDIIKGIRDISVVMTKEQIRSAWDALKMRHDSLQRMETLRFQPGDKVSFEVRGTKKVGVVKKVNQKTIAVTVEENTFGQKRTTIWKVASVMLSKEV